MGYSKGSLIYVVPRKAFRCIVKQAPEFNEQVCQELEEDGGGHEQRTLVVSQNKPGLDVGLKL